MANENNPQPGLPRQVHSHGLYDLDVDTAALSPGACARLVREQVQGGSAPSAFAQLRQRRTRSTA